MESDARIAACQPKVKDHGQRNKFEYAGAGGGFMDRFGFLFCRGRLFDTLEEDRGQYDATWEVFWATRASFFVRRRCFHQPQGLDDALFAHMPPAALCWRLQHPGHRTLVSPKSPVQLPAGATYT